MKLSTRARYGTRLMLELALNYKKGPILLKDIARSQEVSEGYLEHLIPLLRTAGLVISNRGAHGGYALAKPPSQITLRQIVQALEGSLAIVECVASPQVCDRSNFCITREIWDEMSQKLTEVLDSTTLEDIVKRQRQKQKPQPFMYSI